MYIYTYIYIFIYNRIYSDNLVVSPYPPVFFPPQEASKSITKRNLAKSEAMKDEMMGEIWF
jgi:hypothetical protein